MNNEDIQFIIDNLDKDTSKLMFKYDKDLSKRFLINQIGKRQKTINKLPSLYSKFDFIFPQNSKAIEQCSSEISAKIKSKFFKGDKFIDLTGGLGIDFIHISKGYNVSYYNELDLDLYHLALNNFKDENIEFSNSKAEDLDIINNEYFDLIYIDPDRRNNNNKKLVLLEDLSPNIVELEKNLKYKNLLIKLSPLFEINEFYKYYTYFDVWLIQVDGELKELLLHLNKDIISNNLKIIEIIKDDFKEYNYEISKEMIPTSDNNFKYLFEPIVSILKANLQDKIAIDNGLSKINANTQYLFSNEVKTDLPGNFFKIELKLNYNKKDFEKNNIDSGIIKIRNFDDSISSIKKKLKLKESNDRYLLFTKDHQNKNTCFVCKKIKM